MKFLVLCTLMLCCLSLSAGETKVTGKAEDVGNTQNTLPVQKEEAIKQKEVKTVEKVKLQDPIKRVIKSKVSGVAKERGTRRALKNTAVVFKHDNGIVQVETDEKGNFETALVPGKYLMIIPAVGYEKLETEIVVVKNEKLVLDVKMEPLTINPYLVVVKGKKFKSEVSAQRISVQEASVIPGSNRDILKVIASMPGVNSVSVFNGYGSGLLIRGSNANDTIFHLNDQWIPQIYHFMGFESIIEPELVESIDFFAGGMTAEYAEATGGAVTINVRDPRTDRFGGYVNVSPLSASFMVETPLSEKDSIAFGMKRGLLDYYVQGMNSAGIIGDSVDFIKYPLYYDGSLVYTHKFSKNNKFKLIGVGSSDEFIMGIDNDSASTKVGDSISNTSKFAEVVGEWTYKKGKFKSSLSQMFMAHRFKFDLGVRSYFQMDNYQSSLSEKMEYKLSKKHRLKGGIRLITTRIDMDSNFFLPPMEGDVDDSIEAEIRDDSSNVYYMPAIYFMDQIKDGKFLITPGINFVYGSTAKKYYIDPKLSIKYKHSKDLTFKFAAGQYSKLPSPEQSLEPWSKSKPDPRTMYHAIAGFEKYLTDNIFLDIQTYYKYSSTEILRDPLDSTKYTNDGKAQIYGAEVLLRHELTDNFFGWVSYSWTVSKRKDGKDQPWRFFDGDVPHNLTAVASYKLNKYWQFGARFKYASGTPYTDLTTADVSFDAQENEYKVIPGTYTTNADRLDSSHQLDVRIDKYWLFDNWILSTYLDVQNAYFRKNPIAMAFSEDKSKKSEITGLPVMVFFGLKADF